MRPVVVVPDPADNDSVSDEVGLLTDPRARMTLTLVAMRMYYTMRSFGDEYETADTLLKAPQRGHMTLEPTMTSMPFRRVLLEAVGAIIYAMEWTQSSVDDLEPPPCRPQGEGPLLGPLEPGSRLLYPPSSGGWNNYRSRLRRLFEMMLVVDYGFQPRPLRSGRTLEGAFVYGWSALESFADTLVRTAQAWRYRQLLPTARHWTIFVNTMLSWDDGIRGLKVPVWDIATMLFYYRLHREPGDLADYKHGWIGYTGVLQEMIAEVPTRGADRLQRKLSLDAHILIPRFVRDRELQKQMLVAAQDIAAQHGCHLAPPKMPKPSMWQRLLGRASSQQGPGDGEKCSETQRLLGNLE
jgi:hypothetical protein